ncbi:MAG: M15 family metallopeptidase [Elusimicrobia bacterium]|nr:M15 family metallopeptidase [Elusimicrobiota bacterium]
MKIKWLFIFLLLPPLLPAQEDAVPPAFTAGDIQLREAGFVNMAYPPFPKFYFDMRYAGTENFTGKKIYNFRSCWLRKEAAEAVVKAYDLLQKRRPGLTFLFYDCYRPESDQQTLWDAYPDPRYIAPPEKGSRHSRGMAADITLAGADGAPLEMPTGFDSFSPLAHMNYNGKKISASAKQNRELLKQIMLDAGFTYTRTEWWHFDKIGWAEYPIEDIQPED